MPLHFSSHHKSRGQLGASPNSVVSSPSVNKTATFGLGPGQWKVKDEGHPANLLASLRALRSSGFLADITFTYNEENIRANRVILAAISPVMRNVFTKRESLLNAEAIPPEALHQLVQFIYNVNAEIRVESIKQIHVAAKVLKVAAVEKMCDNILKILPNQPPPEQKPRRPKLQRSINFDETSSTGGDDVTDVQSCVSDKENVSQISGSESTDSSCDLQSLAIPASYSSSSGLKRDLRPSIKLTFHSHSSSPLNRSLEDLGAAASSESLETGCNDSPPRENEAPFPADEKSKMTAQRSEPQLQKLSKSFDEKVRIQPRSGSYNSSSIAGGNSPILLSSVLGGEAGKPPALKKSPARRRPARGAQRESDRANGTWPTRARVGNDKRGSIPDEWKKLGERKEESGVEQKTEVRKRTRKSRDSYTVGFRSKSVPGLLKGLNSLREQNLFCDLTLIVGNARINCHKVVLAASSPVFSAIVRKIENREIVLTKVDETAVQEIIRFIYNGQCTIEKDNVSGILRAAYRFQFKFLVLQCANYLEVNCSSHGGSFFSCDNVLLIFKLAGLYGCARLREESRKFAVARFWELTETQAFKELSSLDLNRLVSCESLRTARIRDNELELQFFLALIRWLTYKSDARLPIMTSRVMKFVQFDNMKRSVLNRIVSKETVVMRDQETKQRILLALNNHSAAPQSLPLLFGGSSPIKQPRDSKVVAFVSHNDSSDAKKLNNKIYRVNPVENTWEDYGPAPVTWGGYSVTSWGGAIYVAGGRDVRKNKHTSCDVYRYEKQQWSQLPSMKIERSHFSLVPMNGTLYAIGGMTEHVEKGVPGYQITSCIEHLVVDTRRGNLKWRMTSLSLPTPSYFHSALACQATMRFSALDETFAKVDKNKPAKNRLSPKHLRSTGEKSPPFNRASPRQSALKYQKPVQESADDDARNHNVTKHVILVCGGKSKPMQNLMIDVAGERFVEKRPLPCPCTSPMTSSSGSRVYLMSSGSGDSSQVNSLLYEYSFVADQWSEIKLPPISMSHNAPAGSGKLTRLRASFRRDERPTLGSTGSTGSTASRAQAACTACRDTLVCLVWTGSDVTTHTYDVTTMTWSSGARRKSFEQAPRSIRLCVLPGNGAR